MQVNEVTELRTEAGVGVITVDSPPVNAFSAKVRQGIAAAMEEALADTAVEAIVLRCAGRTFFAGADITEFGKPPVPPSLREVQAIVESSPKPVVAAIHGTALGGGLELALVCHYRLATRSARFGLPEVNLGLLPGAGGTQRLPRIVGVERALELVTSGRQIGASEALVMGLIDCVTEEDDLRAAAIAYAAQVVAEKRPLVRIRDRDDKLEEARANPKLFADFRKAHARQFRGYKAPENIIRAVETALKLPFDEAMVQERVLFNELFHGDQTAAMRHIFFAERQVTKIPDIGAEIQPLPVKKVAVIGAGTMGGGIAMNFANVGIPVTLIETNREALERGLGVIRKNYEISASRGKIDPGDVETRMALLQPSLAFDDVADADLVIEAVYENIDVKRAVFVRLDAVARPGAILATNTSYLDIDEIAAATSRPESVLGLHFFSPANIMKLLEIVRTKNTAKPVVATAVRLAKKIGKIGVTVGNGFGFVGNRILAARNTQCDALLLEGATPEQVDRVLYDFGFPMGHFQMRDLVGLDVGWNRETTSSANVREILNEMGRHGQKTRAGYYDYDDKRNHRPSAVVAKVVEDFAAREGVKRRTVPDAEILDRILYAMVNEGAKILDEGIAARASDIDVIWVTGYGWPKYRGGPMFWADQQGPATVLAHLQQLRDAYGEAFAPSAWIERRVAEKRTFGAS